MAFGPFSSGGVVAKEHHAQGDGGNDDERDDVGDSPGFVVREALVFDKGVEDGGYREAISHQLTTFSSQIGQKGTY